MLLVVNRVAIPHLTGGLGWGGTWFTWVTVSIPPPSPDQRKTNRFSSGCVFLSGQLGRVGGGWVGKSLLLRVHFISCSHVEAK